ncbi:MAG: tyrosine-type recombinase/integrase [Candidatus Magnetoovum sp. WYHC-5]|nr:tyrosine-type recombinase/integrase [Candidatus Magnetoovum sp. WYHC-5]
MAVSETYNISMRLFQRENGTWYAEMERDKRISLRTKDKTLAQRLFNQLKKDYLKSKIFQLEDKKIIKLSIFTDEFLKYIKDNRTHDTYRAYSLALRTLKEYIGDIELSVINVQKIDKFISSLNQKKLKKVSINNYIRHLKSAFQKAVDWEYIKSNPFKNVKPYQIINIPRYLSQDEIDKLLTVIKDEEFKIMILLFLNTGMRRKELLNLEWTDIKTDYIHLKKTKRNLERAFPMTDKTKALLNDLKQISKGKRLFRWTDINFISKMFKASAKKAGLEDIKLHDLRHTFASYLAMAGESLNTIQELLGHQQISTTQIYSHLSQDHLKNALSKLNFASKERPVKIVNGGNGRK